MTSQKPHVSVIVPVRNAERLLPSLIGALVDQDYPAERRELVLVDNGSTDDTARVAEAAGARVVREDRPGYGSALDRGIREATGDFIVLGDADGSYRFDDLGPLLESLERGADLVMGSRLRGRIEPGAMPFTCTSGARARARLLVRPSRPALEAT